jgi:hypothetical protein
MIEYRNKKGELKMKAKMIFTLKNDMTVILAYVIILALTALVAVSASALADAPSKMTICREIGQGKYEHLNEILAPNSSLRDVKLNNKGEPIYNVQQITELSTLNTECVFRIMPFTALISLLGESLKNSYTKLFKS